MLKQKQIFKKTKRGGVRQIVQEIYLRDDIFCGSMKCNSLQVCLQSRHALESNATAYLIPDMGVLQDQIDMFEQSECFSNVILLQTVLNSIQKKNGLIYKRLREILRDKPEKHWYLFSNEYHQQIAVQKGTSESTQERDHRAILNAAEWYSNHIEQIPILFLSNDTDLRQQATQRGVHAQTIQDYCHDKTAQFPEISNLLVEHDAQDDQDAFQYEEYKPKAEIEKGLRSGVLFQGVLRVALHNYREAVVPVDSLDHDILIQGMSHMNRAINGDTVVVEILPKNQWKAPSRFLLKEEMVEGLNEAIDELDDEPDPDKSESASEKPEDKSRPIQTTGKVVGIIKKNWKPVCGSFDSHSNPAATWHLFLPADRRIPRIRVKSRQVSQLKGKRVVVVIDGWSSKSRLPHGHYARTLGQQGDKETETELILMQHDIPYHPFSEKVLQCLPSSGWTADTDPDSKNPLRRDFRDLVVCSVDPPGCTDIDDALHVRPLVNGNVEIGVHIADVTHFVQEGSALDDEAAERGTTVYLVNKRIDMLPKLLGENLCSLMPNVDRFAFSVLWELDKDANIVQVEFCKSIIRSQAALTYEEAQLRIDDARMQDELSVNLRTLLAYSKVLRKTRIDKGSLTLASPEIKFVRDSETQDPVEVQMYQLRETNSMVEEFMLLANISVAQKIFQHFPTCALLRRHPPPNPKNFANLISALEREGFKIDLSSSKTLGMSLDQIHKAENPYFNTLARILTTRCMAQAVYFSSGANTEDEFLHYGLAAEIYTHFTSPIRRYADDIVHRLLGCAIGVYAPSLKLNNHRVQRIANVINIRHRMAQMASRSSTELFTHIFFDGKTLVENAFITRIKANGFTVLIPKYGLESPIFLQKGAASEFDEERQTLKMGEISLRLFDQVRVEISVADSQTTVLCINPPLHTPKLPASLTQPIQKIDKNNNNNKSNNTQNNANSDKSTKNKKNPKNQAPKSSTASKKAAKGSETVPVKKAKQEKN